MSKHVKQTLVATAAAALLLSGCGQGRYAPTLPANQAMGPAQAMSTKTLEKGFKDIFMAAFSKMDVNQDKRVDEYEAGSVLALRDFQKADRNHDGKLTRTEFMNYSIGDGFLGLFRQDKHKFMEQARRALLKGFEKLDKNHDYFVERDEMSTPDLKKVGLNLTIDGLRMKAEITEFDFELFDLADHTKDQQLSQAEFEDYCLSAFIRAINPDYGNEPAPQPDTPGTDSW